MSFDQEITRKDLHIVADNTTPNTLHQEYLEHATLAAATVKPVGPDFEPEPEKIIIPRGGPLTPKEWENRTKAWLGSRDAT